MLHTEIFSSEIEIIGGTYKTLFIEVNNNQHVKKGKCIFD